MLLAITSAFLLLALGDSLSELFDFGFALAFLLSASGDGLWKIEHTLSAMSFQAVLCTDDRSLPRTTPVSLRSKSTASGEFLDQVDGLI